MDMDAFYASVEQRDNPALRGKPVIVGGMSNRGVVSTASYEARIYGVHSAMPIFQAKKRCPDGIFVPVRMSRYKEVSREIMAVLKSFSPIVEQVSIDEAFMDASGLGRLHGPPADLAAAIKRHIFQKTCLTCSIGIAPNKFMAKIASDMKKPDGLTIIEQDELDTILGKLPVRKTPGVGINTVDKLHKLNIFTIRDLRQYSDTYLLREIGQLGKKLLEYSKGIDHSPVVPFTEPKSISSEDTLEEDTNDLKTLKKWILRQSEIVATKLRAGGLKGETVTLKMKRSDFKLSTKARTLDKPTNSTNMIYRCGVQLLSECELSAKYRLVGIGISKLVHDDRQGSLQLNLFDTGVRPEKSWKLVDMAMDHIKDRFGKDAITRGGLLEDSENRDPEPE